MKKWLGLTLRFTEGLRGPSNRYMRPSSAHCNDGVPFPVDEADTRIELPQLSPAPTEFSRAPLPIMNPRSWFGDLTGYFVYILFTATLGPLLFGFHLVCNVQVAMQLN